MRVWDNILHAARQGVVLRVRVFRKTCASEDRDRQSEKRWQERLKQQTQQNSHSHA